MGTEGNGNIVFSEYEETTEFMGGETRRFELWADYNLWAISTRKMIHKIMDDYSDYDHMVFIQLISCKMIQLIPYKWWEL